MDERRLLVRPVTPERWKDFARLLAARGCPRFCWCMLYRSRRSHEMTREHKREAMGNRVRTETPVGVLAYEGMEPVAWCSVAPHETYARLARSRTMPQVDDQPTWTVLCFFLRRSHRGRGIPERLLRGAVAYARQNGAVIVEGYPHDTMGISATHRGRSGTFAAAGFKPEGTRWVRPWRGAPRRAKARALRPRGETQRVT